MTEAEIRDKLQKIEALFSGATFEGEKAAAGEALQRMRERLEACEKAAPPVEMQFSLADGYAKQLFMALCRRYELQPYRYKRQKRTTVMVRAPEPFINETLWPEFQELNKVLGAHLQEVTERIVRENICAETSEARVVQELA